MRAQNPCSQKVEAGVQSHPWLQSEFKARPKPHLKNKETDNKNVKNDLGPIHSLKPLT